MFTQIKNYFEFDKRGALWKKEIIGGVSTFFAMCYILFVNPSFMSLAPTSEGSLITNWGSDYIGGLFLGTAISSFLATFIMGAISKIPLCQAPGMGLNTFLAFNVAGQFGLGYERALVVVMVSGILYFVVGVSPLRQKMMKAFSGNLKIAIGTMTGLFIAYIGFSNLGIIQQGVWGAPSSVGSYFNNPVVIIGLVGVFLLIALHFLKVPSPIVIFTIISLIMLGILYGANVSYDVATTNQENQTIITSHRMLEDVFTLQNYTDFVKFGDVSASLYQSSIWASTFSQPLSYVAILTFFFISFMDASGTMYSVAAGMGLGLENADKEKNSWNNWFTRANAVEGFTTAVSPFFLQSPVVSFIESKTGVASGAKTGISALVTSVLFLASIALWPILKPLLPINIYDSGGNLIGGVQPISGPILVFIGVLSISHLKDFKWKGNPADIPMLLFTIIMGVIGYSISNGISWGIIVYSFTSLIYSLSRFVSEDIIKKKKYKSFIEKEEKQAKETNHSTNLNIKSYWQIFKSKTNNEFNGVILITSSFALIYVILNSLILAGVLSAS
ncbi:MAG: NCS2 family permease [Malacoplasma sp.]|nr:NCS2 family permease [Malacoplasma sp.]MDE7112478.1 NCS2 family permease [Malacoplasma sp.]